MQKIPQTSTRKRKNAKNRCSEHVILSMQKLTSPERLSKLVLAFVLIPLQSPLMSRLLVSVSLLALALFSRLLVALIAFSPSDSIGVDFPPFSACWLLMICLMQFLHSPSGWLCIPFSPDLLVLLRLLAFSALAPLAAPLAAPLHLSLLSLLSLMFLPCLSVVHDDPAAVQFADRDVSVLKN